MRFWMTICSVLLGGSALAGVEELPRFETVPAGVYKAQMGTSTDRWLPDGYKRVEVKKAFAIARDPVTVREYAQFVNSSSRPYPRHLTQLNQVLDAPMRLSWYDAKIYAEWYSRTHKGTYAMASRVQWAAAAIHRTDGPDGAVGCPWREVPRCLKNKPTPVPQLAAGRIRGPWGNVSEWSADGEGRCNYVHGQRNFMTMPGHGFKDFSCFDPNTLTPTVGFRLVRLSPD